MSTSQTIDLKHIARVEGYGRLVVNIEEGKVKDAQFRVLEGARFFEGFLKEKNYKDVPLIVSRICAICSVSHSVVATRAVENAVGIRPSEQTHLLRKLLVFSETIQSHVLHEYFLAIPDYLGQPSAIAMASSHPDLVKRAFAHKSLANEMQRKIGGRAVHPIRNVVGGFTMYPDMKDLQEFREKLPVLIDETLDTIKIFRDLPDQPKLVEPRGDWVAIRDPEEYAYYQAEQLAFSGGTFPKAEYKEKLVEEVRPYSHTKFSTLNGESFMVGALARLNINHALLTEKGKEALELSGLQLPDKDTYHINMAQLVETVDAAQRSIDLIDHFLASGFEREDLKRFEPHPGNGIAITEAPRGLLIHEYSFGDDLKCNYANVITPTAYNQYRMETDCEDLIPRIASEPKENIELKLNMLIRAYDPCISCSAHAAKLKVEFE